MLLSHQHKYCFMQCLNIVFRRKFSSHQFHHATSHRTFSKVHVNVTGLSESLIRKAGIIYLQRFYTMEMKDSHSSKYHPPSTLEQIEIAMSEAFGDATELSSQEWSDIKDSLMINFFTLTEDNFDSIVMNVLLFSNKLNLGHSFMQYLKEMSVKPNLITCSKYMALCGNNIDQCHENIILGIYDDIKSTLDSSFVLDGTTVRHVSIGLCETRQWQKVFNYVKKVPVTPHPQTINSLAKAAFKNGEEKLAWNMVTSWYQRTMTACHPVFEECAKLASRKYLSNRVEGDRLMLKLLLFLQSKHFVPNQSLAKEIANYFQCHKLKWNIKYAKVNSYGVCCECKNDLAPLILSYEEFVTLKKEFFHKALYKSDFFINTTRNEMDNFIRFVNQHQPFDVVVDGLNVSYIGNEVPDKKTCAFKLLEVVTKLSSESKVLIIARRHMFYWPKNIMDKIRRKALIFYTSNISEDDPFMVYAALSSGPKALIASSDLMRDHVSRLDDPCLISLFNRWQCSHQLYVSVDAEESIIFTGPLKHSIAVQGSMNTGWHIPYDDAFIRDSYEHLNNWLCINLSR